MHALHVLQILFDSRATVHTLQCTSYSARTTVHGLLHCSNATVHALFSCSYAPMHASYATMDALLHFTCTTLHSSYATKIKQLFANSVSVLRRTLSIICFHQFENNTVPLDKLLGIWVIKLLVIRCWRVPAGTGIPSLRYFY